MSANNSVYLATTENSAPPELDPNPEPESTAKSCGARRLVAVEDENSAGGAGDPLLKAPSRCRTSERYRTRIRARCRRIQYRTNSRILAYNETRQA